MISASYELNIYFAIFDDKYKLQQDLGNIALDNVPLETDSFCGLPRLYSVCEILFVTGRFS